MYVVHDDFPSDCWWVIHWRVLSTTSNIFVVSDNIIWKYFAAEFHNKWLRITLSREDRKCIDQIWILGDLSTKRMNEYSKNILSTSGWNYSKPCIMIHKNLYFSRHLPVYIISILKMVYVKSCALTPHHHRLWRAILHIKFATGNGETLIIE